MPRRVPDQKRISAFKVRSLFFKQPVVRRQARQKHQCGDIRGRFSGHPVMDRTGGGAVASFNHGISPFPPLRYG